MLREVIESRIHKINSSNLSMRFMKPKNLSVIVNVTLCCVIGKENFAAVLVVFNKKRMVPLLELRYTYFIIYYSYLIIKHCINKFISYFCVNKIKKNLLIAFV
ncbi:UNVERIFIED_CONTAM: hypothetical protein NCL1_20967 [Trichonephila clavipes]